MKHRTAVWLALAGASLLSCHGSDSAMVDSMSTDATGSTSAVADTTTTSLPPDGSTSMPGDTGTSTTTVTTGDCEPGIFDESQFGDACFQ